ncbi:MAG: phosphodiester glycosidase family protein [Chlorobia bacterium]|nr:phosphodiester glycosidase family protein [Fimbriimonadaceae bacterium]
MSFALVATVVPARPAARPIAYDSFIRDKALFHVVKADLASGLVHPTAVYNRGLTSSWKLVAGSNATVGITGTFFAPSSGYPVGDVLVDGDLKVRGYRGSAIGVDFFGGVKIFDTRFKQEYDWSQYKFGIRGAVRLVANGVVCPNPKAQRFRDRRIWGKASRTAVGLDKSGKLILIATKNSVTLSQLGKAMVSRGVVNAVSMDGGGSTCLYYRGKMVIGTGRRLSNMFVLQEKAAF